MKNTFSRILALVVALSMFLVPSAFAAERNAGSVSIGNFEIAIGEETLSLPLYLTLGGGADVEGARGYFTANLSTAEQVALSAVAALENGEIKAYLNGMNYGLTVPLEQLVTLFEEYAGGSIEDLMAEAISESISPELQLSIASLLESAATMNAAEIGDPLAFMESLGLTLTEQGTAAVTIFDTELEAAQVDISMKPISLKQMTAALRSAKPEAEAFFAEYFAFLNQMMADAGEDMTIEEAFELIKIGFSGSIYVADAGMTASILANITIVDGEEEITLELPFNLHVLEDENGSYFDIALDMPIEEEGLWMDIYMDDFADEAGAYSNMIFSISIYDLETIESSTDVILQLYTSDTEDGYTVGTDFSYAEGEEVSYGGISHTLYETILTEESDVYNGYVHAYVDAAGIAGELLMDTNLTLTTVPEGELLTLNESINPLEADEAALEKLGNDASIALMSTLGVLMQDANIASILGGLMG